MQAVQKELYEVKAEIRQSIAVGVMRLLSNPNQALVIRFKREGQEHFTPDFRIKYMKTAGGMQIAFHDIVVNGLGSGRYFAAGEAQAIMDAAIGQIRRIITRQDEFADRFKRDDQRVVDLQVILVDEEVQPVGHTKHDEYLDIFPDATTITLEMPPGMKTGQTTLPFIE